MLTNNKLIKELKKNLTPDNVLATPEERYVYAQDASNIRDINRLPDAVVFVNNIEDIQKVLLTANKHKIPVICRVA